MFCYDIFLEGVRINVTTYELTVIILAVILNQWRIQGGAKIRFHAVFTKNKASPTLGVGAPASSATVNSELISFLQVLFQYFWVFPEVQPFENSLSLTRYGVFYQNITP